jgi:hypothetical protein
MKENRSQYHPRERMDPNGYWFHFDKLLIHAGALARRSRTVPHGKPFKRFPVLFAASEHRAEATV